MKLKAVIFALIMVFAASLIGCSESPKPAQSTKLRTVDDLKDKKIGVLLGSVDDSYINKTYPHATVLPFKTPSDLITAVRAGKVDAAFYIREALLEVMRKDKELGFLKEKVYPIPIGMGFNQDNDQLREQFNIFLKQIKTNGVYDDMVNRRIEKGLTEMPTVENTRENGTLVVGFVSDKGLPFSAVKNNKVVGFDIELAERFAAYLGKDVKLVDMDFGSLINAVASKKIDMVASTLVITDERKKQIDFSDPYYEINSSAFTRKDNLDTSASNKLAKLDDIADKRVAVFTGTVHDKFVADKYPKAKISRYDSSADMILAVKTGKVDVALMDLLTTKVSLRSNPDLGILTEDALSLPLGVGFSKSDPALCERFNKFLEESRANGTYKKMYDRWFENNPEEAIMPNIKLPKNGKKLVLGVAVADLPYVAVMNGKYVGFDIEMMQRFAQHEGMQLEIVPMEFASLIAALASGKVDAITDGIAITPERSKQVAFSDSYVIFKTAVFGLKKNLAKYDGETEAASTMPLWKKISDSFYSNMVLENRYLLIVDGLKVTAIISIFALIFGTLLGALICFMRMAQNKVLSIIARVYISILRGTPVLVLLMIIFYIVFASVNINPVIVAVIAFGMNFAAYVSEMFRTSIESIDRGQREAGIAGGFTPIQTFLYIIMPQALRQVLPVYRGEFISMVKMTSIVGYIAVQDLTKASDIIRSRTFDAFFPLVMVAVLYFLVSWLLGLSLEYLEVIADPKRNRKLGGVG